MIRFDSNYELLKGVSDLEYEIAIEMIYLQVYNPISYS